jgi:uncharacterized protein YfdQ (DUF2303 family)
MDSTAINAIRDLALDALGRGVVLGDNRTALLRHDQSLTSMEPHSLGRFRFRGKLTTRSLADFIEYSQRRHAEFKITEADVDPDDPKMLRGFVDADNLVATMFFNLGTRVEPGHGDDIAALTLKKTAPFQAAEAANAHKFDQQGLINWLEDWQGYVSADVALSAVIAAVRKINLTAKTESSHTTDVTRAARSTFEEVEAKSAADLPEFLTFRCMPYLGLPEVTITFRLTILTGDKPTLLLRAMAFEALKEAIAESFKHALNIGLADVADLTIGSFTP